MRKRILIIDGEMGYGKVLKVSLEKNFFSADISANGSNGLLRALNIHYDLILISVLLPGMDGFHVLKKLREVKSTPVIMLSTQNDDNAKSFYLNSGANDCVRKSYSCTGTVEKVKGLVDKQSNDVIELVNNL